MASGHDERLDGRVDELLPGAARPSWMSNRRAAVVIVALEVIP
ncbi:hypothetical protein [Streptomyces deccanensis]|nr:hypothetical protein [Streptomyces deccanensis]